MKKYAIIANKFVIIDLERGVQVELERAEAKSLARFLLVELHICRFYLNDGRAAHLLDKEFRQLLELKYGVDKCKELLHLKD